MAWMRDILQGQQGISRMGLIPAFQHFMFFGNKSDEEAGLPEIWQVNGYKNIEYLDTIDTMSVHNLPQYEGKAAIFVGMSPILNKSWHMLKEVDENFIIIATNSSAKFLVDRGIIPHFVVLLDGRKGDWSLDLNGKASDTIGIFSACAEPETLRNWRGKTMIVPYGVKDEKLKSMIEERWGKGLASGGNAINSAIAVFILKTSIKIMLLAGNELSFKGSYYADRKSNNDNLAYFMTKNIYGEEVKTFIPLFEYKIWLENIIGQLYPEYYFCNCSEGTLGVDVDGSLLPFLCHKPLDYAIQEVKEAKEIENQDLNYKLKYLYDYFYDHDLGNCIRGRGVWKYISQNFQFKKGLDVGCGRANGVEWARKHGHDVYGTDISESAKKCWEERGVLEYCSVCPANKMPYQDNEFDMINCSEVLEHISEEDIPSSLQEILRVGSDKFLFTIALQPENIPIGGFVQTHITIKRPEWWFKEFAKAGYYVAAAAHGSKMTGMTILAVKNEKPYEEGTSIFPKDEDGEIKLLVFEHCDKPSKGDWEEDL